MVLNYYFIFNYKFFEILQIPAKFQAAMFLCSRFIFNQKF